MKTALRALPRLHVLSEDIPTLLSVLNVGQTGGLPVAIVSKCGNYTIRVGPCKGTGTSLIKAYENLREKMAAFMAQK